MNWSYTSNVAEVRPNTIEAEAKWNNRIGWVLCLCADTSRSRCMHNRQHNPPANTMLKLNECNNFIVDVCLCFFLDFGQSERQALVGSLQEEYQMLEWMSEHRVDFGRSQELCWQIWSACAVYSTDGIESADIRCTGTRAQHGTMNDDVGKRKYINHRE